MNGTGVADTAEQGAYLKSELDRLLQATATAARAATHALQCHVQLCPSYTAPIEPSAKKPPEDTIGRALQDFCRIINTDPNGRTRHPYSGAQICHQRRARLGGLQHVLFGQVLFDDDGGCIGNIAFAFLESDWDSPGLLECCLSMARNAEFLLSMFGSKVALELDLLAVNKRVARLQRLAQMDPLSGLENSAAFEEKVRQRLTHTSEAGAFVLVDIDHFKSINDLYGHQFGDTYIKCIAGAIATAFSNRSIVGRLGGDEFSVFVDVPVQGKGHLDALLSQCCSAIQRATAMLGKPDLGRVSVGASFFPAQASTYETLFELADTALYASKDSGRSVTTVFNKDVHARYNNRELGHRFRRALAQNQIVPALQPIVDLKTGLCAGYEVLSRWVDKDRGLLEPDQFRAVFSDHQLAERLTRTIVHQALDAFVNDLGHTASSDRPTPTLGFNLTYFDLMNREFVFDLQNSLGDFAIDWKSIVIEVTETVMLGTRNGQVFRSLDELRRRGAKVALDDFATGYGGLRHLREWPIDILKVDKGFITNLGQDKRDRAIVEGIISIASTCGFSVVAEGVETPEQVRLLREMQCSFGQGYLFSRPLTCDQLHLAAPSYDLHALSRPYQRPTPMAPAAQTLAKAEAGR